MKPLVWILLGALLTAAPLAAQSVTPFADKPALLTSVGQSADIEMLKVLLNRSRIPFSADPLVTAATLPAEARTLVLAVGGSSKGLGAAGISVEAELERARGLIGRARERGLKIIAVHVGGEGRRGALSDAFIELCVPAADYAVVVTDGDKDGLFTRLAAGAGIPLTKSDRISGVQGPLAAAFK